MISKKNPGHELPPDFTSHITVDDVTYMVHTEVMGPRHKKVTSRVYLDGEILFSKDKSYASIAERRDLNAKLNGLMEEFHKSVLERFTTELRKKRKKKQEYFEEARKLLSRGKGREALEILQEGLKTYPADPFLLSYFGCLVSLVGRRPESGIKICRDAIKRLKESIPIGGDVFFPVFYLNLGRAYLGAKSKREAVKAFHVGLRADPDDKEILSELAKLGNRKPPPLPFLGRQNPINKYIGKFVRRPPV